MHANECATNVVDFCTLYNISSYLDLVVPLPTVHSLRFVGLDNICQSLEQSCWNFNLLLRPQQLFVIRLLGVENERFNIYKEERNETTAKSNC